MTALKPTVESDVWPVKDPYQERDFLRSLVTSKVCCHPECDRTDVTAHHLWPRGFLKDSSWLVKLPGEEKPIVHVAGLCGHGTTGHHGDAEEHRGWIRYENGIFNWYEARVDPDDNPGGFGKWTLVGPLDPQPGQVEHPKKKARKPRGKNEKARNRKNISIAVPTDERENGAGIMDELIDACRETWADDMGWSSSCPAYYVLVAAMAKALQ